MGWPPVINNLFTFFFTQQVFHNIHQPFLIFISIRNVGNDRIHKSHKIYQLIVGQFPLPMQTKHLISKIGQFFYTLAPYFFPLKSSSHISQYKTECREITASPELTPWSILPKSHCQNHNLFLCHY